MGIKFRICQNKTTDALRKTFKATPLTPPETQIRPLFVLSFRNGKVGRRGSFKDLFEDSKGLNPKPKATTVADASFERTQSIKLGASADVMGALLGGFKIDASPVRAALEGAREISFSFTNIQRLSVDLNKLGGVLADKRLNLNNSSVKIFLEDKHPAEMLLVTDVLVSNALSINVESTRNTDFKIQLSPVQSFIAGAALKVKTTQHQEKTIAFEGEEQLTFAFSCVRVQIDRQTGAVSLGLPADPRDGFESTGAAKGQVKPEYIELDDDPAQPGFLELDEAE